MVGFERIYAVSSLGRVMRTSPGLGTWVGKVLQPWTTRGYAALKLRSGERASSRYVHRLVAEAFLGPRPLGHQVNHKNLRKHDNAAANLEYVTPRENTRHAADAGRLRRGSRIPWARLTEEQVRQIRQAARTGVRQCALGAQFGIAQATVSNIVQGKTWRHVA